VTGSRIHSSLVIKIIKNQRTFQLDFGPISAQFRIVAPKSAAGKRLPSALPCWAVFATRATQPRQHSQTPCRYLTCRDVRRRPFSDRRFALSVCFRRSSARSRSRNARTGTVGDVHKCEPAARLACHSRWLAARLVTCLWRVWGDSHGRLSPLFTACVHVCRVRKPGAAIAPLSRVELAAVHRAQARRTTVPAPAFLPGEGGAARGLQGEDRAAAIAYSAAPTGGI
jgi:hypothetical protein